MNKNWQKSTRQELFFFFSCFHNHVSKSLTKDHYPFVRTFFSSSASQLVFSSSASQLVSTLFFESVTKTKRKKKKKKKKRNTDKKKDGKIRTYKYCGKQWIYKKEEGDGGWGVERERVGRLMQQETNHVWLTKSKWLAKLKLLYTLFIIYL